MSYIQRFADQHRLKTRIDEDGTKIIPGKLGHIYEYDGDLMGVMYLSDKGTLKKWNNARKACLAADMTLLQDGDTEGSLSFDRVNPQLVKLAIRAARIKRRKILSPDDRERRAERARTLRTTSRRPVHAVGRTDMAQLTLGAMVPADGESVTETA